MASRTFDSNLQTLPQWWKGLVQYHTDTIVQVADEIEQVLKRYHLDRLCRYTINVESNLFHIRLRAPNEGSGASAAAIAVGQLGDRIGGAYTRYEDRHSINHEWYYSEWDAKHLVGDSVLWLSRLEAAEHAFVLAQISIEKTLTYELRPFFSRVHIKMDFLSEYPKSRIFVRNLPTGYEGSDTWSVAQDLLNEKYGLDPRMLESVTPPKKVEKAAALYVLPADGRLELFRSGGIFVP